MTKGLNIVSRLTFENIPDGTLSTPIPDENQYSNYSYTKAGTVTVETIDGIKFIKLNSTTAKIYSTSIISDQSKKNFQAEFDVIFDNIKTETNLVSIGVTNLLNSLRVVASNNPTQGLRLINGNNQISSYYRFENNKKYTICVGFKDNVISMYIDGTIIGYFYSEEFINSLNITTPSNIILGAPLNNTNDTAITLYGKLGNINISIGLTVKHEESYTKYGTNLVSFLNFENLAGIGTYKTGVEAIYEGIEWRGVESATYSNGYGNIKNISTDLTGEFTVTFSLKKFKVANANILKYGNYSVDYEAGFIPVPEPDVEVNEYTTAALNFENGLVDQIGTTVWTKEGTADVTSANKIFGENSFETKALGDSLSTNSKIITGGSTPFTIEFYALIKGSESSNGNYVTILLTNDILSKKDIIIGRHKVNGSLVFYRKINVIDKTSNKKLFFNEINKFLISYDGAALRIFINDEFDMVVGINDITWYDKTWFLHDNVDNRNHYGLIDNINIHDGIATKVRDTDPYEEFLIVDLAFDGENNSTKIVDNGTLKSNWTGNGNAKLSTTQKFDGFSSMYIPKDTTSSVITPFTENYIFNGKNTFKFDFILNNLPTNNIENCVITSWNGAINKRSFYILIVNINGIFNLRFGKTSDGTSTNSKFLEFPLNSLTVNKQHSVHLVLDDLAVSLYFDGILVNTQANTLPINFNSIGQNIVIGSMYNNTNYTGGFDGYIKNFKIYKGAVVIPESPVGKIQLDFDNNFNDKYGNSTWINNGVTFDQVNSVKGHAAYFNGSNSSGIKSASNSNLNFEDKNFKLSFDMKPTELGRQYNSQIVSSAQVGSYVPFTIELGNSTTAISITTTKNNMLSWGASLYSGGVTTLTSSYRQIEVLRNNNVFYLRDNDVIRSMYNLNDTQTLFNLNGGNVTNIGTNRPDLTGTYYKGYLDNFKTYKEDLLTNNDITIFTDPAVTVNYKILDECIYVTGSGPTSTSNGTSIIRLNDSPSLKNFTAEIELYFDATNIYMYGGLIFRTIEYKIRTHQMGYLIYFTVTGGKTHLRFGKGSNSSSGLWTQIHTIDVDSYRNNTYRTLKVIAKDNNFKAYIDNILIFDVIDDSYNMSSQFGMNVFNYFDTAMYSKTKRVNIWDENGNNVYYKDWESKIDYVVDRPAVHLPLETNAINTGFTPLTINSMGNPTYHAVDGKKCIKFESGKYLTINSNNIFNLGTQSDFYIETEVYIPQLHVNFVDPSKITNGHRLFSSNVSWNDARRCEVEISNTGFLRLMHRTNTTEQTTIQLSEQIVENIWYKIKLSRKDDVIKLWLNDNYIEYNDTKLNINFSSNDFVIGYVTQDLGTNSLDGYMSNFKMFVGTSEITETYNDKKVLELDFKPTGKSYLFKDNNNKCLIHPVNITQRDYQDSQYCCTFNGVDQYLQLGKNDLLNFGLDDFIIEIKFKISNLSTTGIILLSSAESNGTLGRAFISIEPTTSSATRPKALQILTTNGSGSSIGLGSSNDVLLNELNDAIITRNGNILTINLNGVVTTRNDFNEILNFNLNNNTYIGWRNYTSQVYLNGTIYSIKVLRNTTDLSLLEDENTDVIIGDTTLTLSNGTDSQEVIFDNKDQNDFRFIHSNDSTKLIVNEQILEVPNVENELNELSLFTDFNAEAKDIKTYNIAFEDEDTFSGNVPIHTQFGEVEDIDTVTDIFHVVDQGDFIVNGFFEGRPEDSRYQIRNRFDYIVMHSDSGQFNYNGINERYIDDYEIYLPDTKETMPIPTEPMIRGYITVSITPTECEGINFGVKVFRRSDNKLIGIYNFNNYICTIDNLDCNKRYDCIIFDQDVNLESRCLSNRTPIPY